MAQDPSSVLFNLNMEDFSLDSSLTETFSNLSIFHPEADLLDGPTVAPISYLSQLTGHSEPSFRGGPLPGFPTVAGSLSDPPSSRPVGVFLGEVPPFGSIGGTADDFNIKSILPLNLNQLRPLSPKHSPQNSPGRDFDYSGPYSPRALIPSADELAVPGLSDSPRSRYLRASHSYVFTTPETLKPGSSTAPIAKDLFFVEETPNLTVKMRKGHCTNCGVTSAPEWRHGPAGRNTLCNACGLKFSRHPGSPRSAESSPRSSPRSPRSPLTPQETPDG